MNADVIVIGAGMVGTSVAWHLQSQGDTVLLIDRKQPGSETSYGNAGLIQREATHLTTFPRHMRDMLRLLPNRASDVRYSLRGLFTHAKPLGQYWRASAPSRLEQATRDWSSLIMHSTQEHAHMASAAGAEDLISKQGWIQLHRSLASFKQGLAQAQDAERFGVKSRILDIHDLLALEPHIHTEHLHAAIHWQNAWQVKNPGELVKSYARNFTERGGHIVCANVQDLHPAAKTWQVTTNAGNFTGSRIVIAAGPWSDALIKPLGYRLPLFPMRGYHQHFKLAEKATPTHALVDVDKGFVMSPMEMGLRITSGAAMTTIDAPEKLDQLKLASRYAQQTLDIENPVGKPWHGSRPFTADMKPVIGKATHHHHLWFAFGHGPQGFTLGPVTGRLIEEMMHGKAPWINPQPFRVERFE